MRVVLFALNGSYSHTNLAVRCLRNPLEDAGFEVRIVERNLRDRRDEILQALYENHAAVYGFSCYIWNISEMLDLAADLKALLPESTVIFGGPEVSFDTERFLNCAFIDCFIVGEGEIALREVCKAIRDGKMPERIVRASEMSDMENRGILYRDGDYPAGGMLYYESSRGCPYRCAYCLSSTCGKLRSKPVKAVLDDLLAFESLSKSIKIIKFVDRTFNADVSRANEIWSALLDERFTKHYHFEICASLLNEESFGILSRFPKGKIQLEIGLQSTNPETLAEVSRHIDPEQVIRATERIHSWGNIHVHLDLIAGLPFESYRRFGQSFDESYFCSDMLQLGFLKLLHGTVLCQHAEKYGYVAMKKAPYTVLRSKWITRDELYRLSRISSLLDRYYSSGHFAEALDYAVRRVPSPFGFYEGLLEYLDKTDGRDIRKLSQPDAFRLLYGYVSTFLTEAELDIFEEKMHADFAAHEARQLPYSAIAGVRRSK